MNYIRTKEIILLYTFIYHKEMENIYWTRQDDCESDQTLLHSSSTTKPLKKTPLSSDMYRLGNPDQTWNNIKIWIEHAIDRRQV